MASYLSWFHWLIPVLLTLVAFSLWVLTLAGLPGNWGLVVLAASVALLASDSQSYHIHWETLAGITLLAIAGEVVEFFAGAVGVSRLGGSKKGGFLSLVGSVVGAIAGLFIGVPIPVIGSLIAALLFGSVGAFLGAVAGERLDGKEWDLAIQIGWGALWGKLLGTLLKTICGTVALAVLLGALWMK